MKHRWLGLTILVMMSITAFGQVSALLGDWVTVDDKTGEQRSIVNLYQGKDGLYYGAISKLLIDVPEKICKLCPDEDKNNQKIRYVSETDKQTVEGHQE